MEQDNGSRMMLHKGAQRVEAEVVKALPIPKSLGPHHRPVPHWELLESLRAEARTRGVVVVKEELAITPDGAKLFALFQLGVEFGGEGAQKQALSLGVRNSTDTSLGLRGVAGSRVFVCDNLALSGSEFVFSRKNTKGLRLDSMVAEGFEKFLVEGERYQKALVGLHEKKVGEVGAKAAIYNAFTIHRVAAVKYLPLVHEAYFEKGELGTGEFKEVEAGTVLGLYNAFTRAFKGMAPTPQFTATRKMGEIVGI